MLVNKSYIKAPTVYLAKQSEQLRESKTVSTEYKCRYFMKVCCVFYGQRCIPLKLFLH